MKKKVLILVTSGIATILEKGAKSRKAGLSSRARDRGFSPATKRVAPGYFVCVAFTRQLEILVTTLRKEKKRERRTNTINY